MNTILQYRRSVEWYEYVFELPWLYILITFIIIFWIFKRTKKDVHSHWNTLIPEFKYSSKDFYKHLKQELLTHQIKGLRTAFVSLKEGGPVSGNRLYLRIEWKEYRFDTCCAPFGDGLFLSWWCIYKTPIGKILLERIPFIGGWLSRRLYRITYYKIDTASMLMTYCHQSILKVADEITKESGIRINDDDRKPILKDVFKR